MIAAELDALKSGDVVQVCLDPTLGSEIRKTRPCLLIQTGGSKFPLIIILPITDAQDKTARKLYVPITDLKTAGLSKASVIDCFQIRAVSTERIAKKFGSIPESLLDDVRTRLAALLDIGEEHVT